MLTSGELISVAAGAALAVVIGLRRPPPLISALLLIAIALLGLGLAYALGALAAVGVYVLIMDIGYVAGLTASLVRELIGGSQRRAVAEVGGLLASEAEIRKISGSNGGVVEVTVFEGRIAPIYMDRGPIEEVAAALSTLASAAMRLMKNGQRQREPGHCRPEPLADLAPDLSSFRPGPQFNVKGQLLRGRRAKVTQRALREKSSPFRAGGSAAKRQQLRPFRP